MCFYRYFIKKKNKLMANLIFVHNFIKYQPATCAPSASPSKLLYFSFEIEIPKIFASLIFEFFSLQLRPSMNSIFASPKLARILFKISCCDFSFIFHPDLCNATNYTELWRSNAMIFNESHTHQLKTCISLESVHRFMKLLSLNVMTRVLFES